MKTLVFLFCFTFSLICFQNAKAGDDGFFPLDFTEAQWVSVEGHSQLLFVKGELYPQIILINQSQNFFAIGKIVQVGADQITVLFRDVTAREWKGVIQKQADASLLVELRAIDQKMSLRLKFEHQVEQR